MTTNSNFSTPKTITAEYQLITPRFLKDTDNSTISPQSFKGVMRFWWRATHWEEVKNDNPKSDSEALKNLHRKEAELFGSSAKKTNKEKIYGQGIFSLKINDRCKSNSPPSAEAENNSFEVILSLHPKHTPDQQKELEELLITIGYFANLGAKSRNGCGSIQLFKLNGTPKKITKKSIEKKIKCLKAGGQPPYTAFSEETYCDYDLLLKEKSPEALRKKIREVREEKNLCTQEKNKRLLVTGLPKKNYKTKLKRRAKGLYFHFYKDDENNGKLCILALTFPTSIYHMKQNLLPQNMPIPNAKDYTNFIVELNLQSK